MSSVPTTRRNHPVTIADISPKCDTIRSRKHVNLSPTVNLSLVACTISKLLQHLIPLQANICGHLKAVKYRTETNYNGLQAITRSTRRPDPTIRPAQLMIMLLLVQLALCSWLTCLTVDAIPALQTVADVALAITASARASILARVTVARKRRTCNTQHSRFLQSSSSAWIKTTIISIGVNFTWFQCYSQTAIC